MTERKPAREIGTTHRPTSTKRTCLDRKLINILVVTLGCVLVFCGFNTAAQCMKNVLEAERKTSKGRFTGDGYITLGIVYLAFSLGNFFAPVVVDLIGAKWTMIVGSAAYCVFILQFIFPDTLVLYFCSCICGCGGSLLRVGQGVTMAQNSNLKTSDRNSAIFFSLFNTNGIWGNILQYFVLRQSVQITGQSRTTLFAGLAGITFLGVCVFGLIRPIGRSSSEENSEPTRTNQKTCMNYSILLARIINSFKNMFKMLGKDQDARFLLFAYISNGAADAVQTGILSAVVGHSLNLGQETKGLMGISAIFIAIGGILAPGLMAGFSNRVSRLGRDLFYLFAFIIRTSNYYLIYVFFPIDSASRDSYQETFVPLSLFSVILTGFLNGFGDGLAQSSVQSLIAVRYKETSASAFAFYHFARTMGISFMFFFGAAFNLLSLAVFLSLLGSFGTLGFCFVEWRFYKHLYKKKPTEELAPLQSID